MVRARSRFLIGALLALACVLSLAATEAAAQQPKRGGTMTILLQPEPPMLMLPLSQFVPVLVTGGKIFQGLLTFDFDLKPIPSLATSWSISPDGLTYTFHLAENVKWNDGKPFTSADVVFSTQVFLMEVHARARGNFQRVASFETPDANTVVYHLKEPFAPFLHAFEVSSAPMVPKHIYEGTDYRQNPANANPVGTGPFKLKEWVRGSYIHMVRNELYWKPGLPYLDEIYFRFLPDAASRAVALESGQVDQSEFDAVEPYDVQRLAQLPHLTMTTNGTTRFFDSSLPKYAYDPKKAAALLDEMGLKPGADGVRVHIKAMPLPYGEVWNRLAEYSRQALGRVGIQLDIEPVDTPTWVQRTTNYEYELTWNYLSQFADPALGVARAYISTNIRKGIPSTNIGGYANPRVDELFAKAAVALNEAEQQRLYSEVQQILVDDVPVGWMLEMQWPTFVSKRFHDVITTGLGPDDSYEAAWRE